LSAETEKRLRRGKVQHQGGKVFFLDPFLEGAEKIPLDQALPEGTWVEVEIQDRTASLQQQVAPTGGALAAVYELAAHHGVDPMLPPECEAEAAAWVAEPGIKDPTLKDLTEVPFVTIDNPDSLDLDQALYVEKDRDGFVVWYALADASYYVRPGSALFREALVRGATYYLPGLVAPMLPLSLCEGLVSLASKVDRRAMVFRLEVGPGGRCRGAEVFRARIHSRAKLSYTGVQAWLDGGPRPCEDKEALEGLRNLVEVGELRMREAEGRHVVRFRRQEVSVSVGGQGLIFVAGAEPRNDVERYNEQISLLTNIQAARMLRDAASDPEVQAIYRTHEPPLHQALEAFSLQLKELVKAHELDPTVWGWNLDGEEPLAAYVRRLPLGEGPWRGVARAIQRQALRTGGRSGFGPEPRGHFGVGAEVYSRFTAPMREVVGIFVHKELWEHLGMQSSRPVPEDVKTRERVVAVSQEVRRKQRTLDQECNRCLLNQFFAADLESSGPVWREATVLGLGRRKIHLRLEEPPIDVKVYAFDLEASWGERIQVEAGSAVVVGEGERILVRVGDRVQVRALGMDPERDRWRLDLEV
jgi:ribonuclease R